MVVFLALVLLQIISVALCVIAIRRLYAYINKYRFDESVYTLLFGFVKLRYAVWLYVLVVAMNALFGVPFAISML